MRVISINALALLIGGRGQAGADVVIAKTDGVIRCSTGDDLVGECQVVGVADVIALGGFAGFDLPVTVLILVLLDTLPCLRQCQTTQPVERLFACQSVGNAVRMHHFQADRQLGVAVRCIITVRLASIRQACCDHA